MSGDVCHTGLELKAGTGDVFGEPAVAACGPSLILDKRAWKDVRPVVKQAWPPAVEVQGNSSPVFTVQWLGVSIVSPGVLGTEGHWDRTSNCTDNQRYYVCTRTRGQSTTQERASVIMIKNEINLSYLAS